MSITDFLPYCNRYIQFYFSVTDTSIGNPADQQSSIFERLIQANQAHKMNFGATGLGLAISKKTD